MMYFLLCYRIDFDNSAKPTNLANSAVLRMLEEEELEKRHGHQSGKCEENFCGFSFSTLYILYMCVVL